MKRILLLLALLGLSSTAYAYGSVQLVTCTFNNKTIVYTNDVISDVEYFDYGIKISLKDGTVIRYGNAVPCEYKKAQTR